MVFSLSATSFVKMLRLLLILILYWKKSNILYLVWRVFMSIIFLFVFITVIFVLLRRYCTFTNIREFKHNATKGFLSRLANKFWTTKATCMIMLSLVQFACTKFTHVCIFAHRVNILTVGMYFVHVNANTYVSIFKQRANIHLGLTKCKSIFTFTYHVFENFSSCECR